LLQNIGASYYSRGQYETAKEYLEEAISWYNDLSKVFENIAYQSDDITSENKEYIKLEISDFEYRHAMCVATTIITHR
jgi:tetratricopeptide (TPR) repeat protein